jgi:hypothetical protein
VKKQIGGEKLPPMWEFFFFYLVKIFTFLKRSRKGFDQRALLKVGQNVTGFRGSSVAGEIAGGTATSANFFH